VKNVPGRKTDVADTTWLSKLAAHGLIHGSSTRVGQYAGIGHSVISVDVEAMSGRRSGAFKDPGHGSLRHRSLGRTARVAKSTTYPQTRAPRPPVHDLLNTAFSAAERAPP
jgi:hypothetical protein